METYKTLTFKEVDKLIDRINKSRNKTKVEYDMILELLEIRYKAIESKSQLYTLLRCTRIDYRTGLATKDDVKSISRRIKESKKQGIVVPERIIRHVSTIASSTPKERKCN